MPLFNVFSFVCARLCPRRDCASVRILFILFYFVNEVCSYRFIVALNAYFMFVLFLYVSRVFVYRSLCCEEQREYERVSAHASSRQSTQSVGVGMKKWYIRSVRVERGRVGFGLLAEFFR